ncbi:hypothetical protein MN608_06985 [Microdochium nivale]|nr:hypothetical protein MN608_06985 [Microdochium nivale]
MQDLPKQTFSPLTAAHAARRTVPGGPAFSLQSINTPRRHLGSKSSQKAQASAAPSVAQASAAASMAQAGAAPEV